MTANEKFTWVNPSTVGVIIPASKTAKKTTILQIWGKKLTSFSFVKKPLTKQGDWDNKSKNVPKIVSKFNTSSKDHKLSKEIWE